MTEGIQSLQKLGEEFARVSADAERARHGAAPRRALFRRGLQARTAMVVGAIAVLLGAGALAVPATRAAFHGAVDSFADWVSGGDDAAPPGRAVLPADDVPPWLRDDPQTRLIAKTGGLGLYVRRSESDQGPQLEFRLGQAMGIADTLDGWRQRLGQETVILLGYTPFAARDPLDAQGRVPVFGITTREIKRVELRYSEGPPLSGTTGDGGFVLLADAWRLPRAIVAYDSSGRVVDRTDVSEYDMRYLCDKDPVCPPEAASRTR